MSKKTLSEVVSEARIICNDYVLCDICLGRMFSKKLGVTSNKLLGRKIKKKLALLDSEKCYICKNLCTNLDSYVKELIDRTNNYSFSSFMVGAILKPSFIDRDDSLKSKYRLRGIDSIKTEITKELSKKFSKKTKTSSEHFEPDLTLTINFKDDTFDIHGRSVFVFGRYEKTVRGIPQKQSSCKECAGKGCLFCDRHGIDSFESVEGKIAQYLYKKFQTEMIKINWIGGEDKDSLVIGTGRPFFAKIVSPRLRKTRFGKSISLDGITLRSLQMADSMPKSPLAFKSVIDIVVISKKTISAVTLRSLKKLSSTIMIHENVDKVNHKSIYSLKYKKINSNEFSVMIKADGGLPVKRFVEGGNVNPNLTDHLGLPCRCKVFDFHEILLNDNN